MFIRHDTSEGMKFIQGILVRRELKKKKGIKHSLGEKGGFPGSSAGKESACNSGDSSLIPGLGRYAGEGICHPFQSSGASMVAQMVRIHCSVGNMGSIPELGKSPGRRAC